MVNILKIQNYQSHKDSILEFSNGVNVIVGNSDSGKSSIIRSLNWLINNRPLGDSFRSKWGGETIVSAMINSNKIERIKTDKDNLYKLNNKEYKAFAQDTPEEIKSVINFSDINLQQQLDVVFLLQKSSGEVAKYINSIIDLDIIDKSLSNIEKIKRKHAKDLETERLLLENNQTELKKYNNLEALEVKIKKAELTEIGLQNKKDKYEVINSIINKIKQAESIIKECDKYLKVENKINDAENSIIKIQGLENKYNLIEKITDNIKLTENMIIQNDIKLERNLAKFKELMPNICPLCEQEINNVCKDN